MRKLVAVLAIVVASMAAFAIMTPTQIGGEYQETLAVILCASAIACTLLPGRAIMPAVIGVSVILAGFWAYALSTGLVSLATPPTAAYSFSAGFVRLALVAALTASVLRTPDSDLADHPHFLRLVSVNFIAWGFVPYLMA